MNKCKFEINTDVFSLIKKIHKEIKSCKSSAQDCFQEINDEEQGNRYLSNVDAFCQCIKFITEDCSKVRIHPKDQDKTFDGIIIEELPHFYVVIPNNNLDIMQNWNKSICTIIENNS